jgi:hypothetical protein
MDLARTTVLAVLCACVTGGGENQPTELRQCYIYGGSNGIRNVASGVIVDKRLAPLPLALVTAGHVLFNMEERRQFGSLGSLYAVFRCFAEIVAEDIYNGDACLKEGRERCWG